MYNLYKKSNYSGTLIYKYFLNCLDLINQSKHLQNVLNRKNIDFKIISDVNIHYISNKQQLKKLNPKINDIAIINDKTIKIYKKQDRKDQKSFFPLEEEILIITTNNEMLFYDENKNKLINLVKKHYPASIKNTSTNSKLLNKIMVKLKKQQINLKQLKITDINNLHQYIINSKSNKIILQMLMTIFLYIIAIPVAISAIGFFVTETLHFAIISAATSPIASAITLAAVYTKAMKKCTLPIDDILVAGSYAFGTIFLGLSSVFLPATPILTTIGTTLTVIGGLGTVYLITIKYRKQTINCVITSLEFMQEQVFPWIKNQYKNVKTKIREKIIAPINNTITKTNNYIATNFTSPIKNFFRIEKL